MLIVSLYFSLFLLLITIVAIKYADFRATSLYVKDTATYALDEYIAVESSEILNSVKSGTNYTISVDSENYSTYLANAFGIVANGNTIQAEKTNGQTVEISNIELIFSNTNQLEINGTLTLTMPVTVGNFNFTELSTTIYFSSNFNFI